MRILILALVLIFPAVATATALPWFSEVAVAREVAIAAYAVLESEEACEVESPSCSGPVDLDYPYRWRDGYIPFLANIAKAISKYDFVQQHDRRRVVAAVVSLAWAETSWGSYRATTYDQENSAGEIGPLQIISCEYAPWVERGINCHDGEYVDSNTRPTRKWLQDWQNSADWAVSWWMENESASAYNGCRSDECGYNLRFERRYDAAIRAL